MLESLPTGENIPTWSDSESLRMPEGMRGVAKLQLALAMHHQVSLSFLITFGEAEPAQLPEQER